MTLLLERPITVTPTIPEGKRPPERKYPIEECVAWVCTTGFGKGVACGHVTWGSQKPIEKCPGCGVVR